MTYNVTLISPEEKERLAGRCAPGPGTRSSPRYSAAVLSSISDDRTLLETWQENFYPMSQNIRSHGRSYVFRDPSVGENTVQFDPYPRLHSSQTSPTTAGSSLLRSDCVVISLRTSTGSLRSTAPALTLPEKVLAWSGYLARERPRRPMASSVIPTPGSSLTTGSLHGSSAQRSLCTDPSGTSTSGRTFPQYGRSSTALSLQTSLTQTGGQWPTSVGGGKGQAAPAFHPRDAHHPAPVPGRFPDTLPAGEVRGACALYGERVFQPSPSRTGRPQDRPPGTIHR